MSWVIGFWPIDRRLTIELRCFLGGLIGTTALHGRSPGLLTTRLYTAPIREEISRRTRASSTWALPGAEMPSGTRKCPLVRLLLTLFLESSCEFSKGLPFPLGGCSHPNRGGGGGCSRNRVLLGAATPHTLIWAMVSRLPCPVFILWLSWAHP